MVKTYDIVITTKQSNAKNKSNKGGNNMKEIRKINSSKVRQMCIKDNYYTKGTNNEYENLLLNLCNDKNMTLKKIEKIATDILQHSDWQSKSRSYGCEYDELLKSVMANLINECCYTFIE